MSKKDFKNGKHEGLDISISILRSKLDYLLTKRSDLYDKYVGKYNKKFKSLLDIIDDQISIVIEIRNNIMSVRKFY